MASTPLDLLQVRADYPGLVGRTYLDTPSMGLMARSTADAGNREQELLMLEGSGPGIRWQVEGRMQVAAQVAAQVGGEAASTVLCQSFTAGLSRLAPLLNYRKKVLLVGGDYPTLHGPFRWNGFEVVLVQPLEDGSIPLLLLEETMRRERPQVVAISHVQWATGHRIDLNAFGDLCRKHGAWSLVDLTQSWCCVPMDLRNTPLDLIGASGYKWPLAGFGNGFFHLSAAVRAELSDQHGLDAVRVLSEGHLDPVPLARLSDALHRHTRMGAGAVWARVQQTCAYAVARFDELGIRILHGREAATRAGIIILEGGQERLDLLRSAGIPAQLRGAGIRIGIHFHTDEFEIDHLATVLKRA